MLQLNMWIATFDAEFADLATAEITAVAGEQCQRHSLAPGVVLMSGVSFFSVAERWQSAPPIFVRHICPVMLEVALTGAPVDIELLAEPLLAELAPLVEPDLSFSVQTRILADVGYKPFDVNTALSDGLVAGGLASLNVRAPQQVVSVVVAERPDYFDALYGFVGLSPTGHNLSGWAGGMRRFARETDQVSRAEFKLLEALEFFHLDLPPRGVALDLGASPGGWTRVLRQHDQYVTAVDPGELDPRLHADSRIRHLRITAEAYLAAEPDRFDLIVNDMRMDARESARLMVAYARQLYPGGFAVMTLKLPALDRRSVIDETFAILDETYTVAGARHLFHNRSEITLLLRPHASRPS